MTEKKTLDWSLGEAASFFQKEDRFTLLTHSSPDGDTLGSAFGLKGLLTAMNKQVAVLCGDALPKKFSYLGRLDEAALEDSAIVALDIADVKLTSGLVRELAEKADLCLDHHPSNTRFAKALCLDGTAAATSELIADLARKLCISPDEKTATALYTGLATDTGCFLYTNTTAKTLRTAADLVTAGADKDYVNRTMFETKTKSRLFMERRALEEMRFFHDGKIAVTVLDYDTIHAPEGDESELDGVAAIPRTVEGVLVGVTLKEKEKGIFKISVRTFEPMDAARICSAFEGGGHARAAGCTVTGEKEQVIASLLAVIEKQFH